MYIARILYPIKVLGPGNRIGIWFDGCEHHCNGCSNPELWNFKDDYRTDLFTIMKLIHSVAEQHVIDGFTLTGGDPFLQAEALREILPFLREVSDDILCYTGYLYEELKDENQDIMDQITVLIDGKYEKEQNHGAALRGSDNQNIYILQDKYREKYEEYLKTAKNDIQNFRTRDSMISVGIHTADYDKRLNEIMTKRGLVKK